MLILCFKIQTNKTLILTIKRRTTAMKKIFKTFYKLLIPIFLFFSFSTSKIFSQSLILFILTNKIYQNLGFSKNAKHVATVFLNASKIMGNPDIIIYPFLFLTVYFLAIRCGLKSPNHQSNFRKFKSIVLRAP